MDEISFRTWAEHIAEDSQFVIDQCVHVGHYYTKDRVRSMVFSGQYLETPAMLKVYDDPRGSDEIHAIATHAQHNTSTKIAPIPVLASKHIDACKGWFISSANNTAMKPFRSPMTSEQRSEFLQLYREYRANIPIEPIRKLTLREYLPAHEFHTQRLSGWFQLAMNADRHREQPILEPSDIIPRYTRVIDIIRATFSQRKMIWCHGHFKPDSLLYNHDTSAYVIIDLAHAGMYPEGYELAFMLWADVLMDGDYTAEYIDWRAHIDGWLTDLAVLAEEFAIDDYDVLIHASLLERLMGTILADITASDMPRTEMIHRLSYLYRLYDQII